MDDKYTIKITRRYRDTGNEDTHYYNGESVMGNEKAYNTRKKSTNVNKFTKEESKKIIKKVEWMYKKNPNNGKLLKIEVLDSETLKPVDMGKREPVYTKFTRFEIMEI